MRPRISAKATAGVSRPGSPKAARLGLVASFSMERAESRLARVAGSRSCFELGDQILDRVDLMREVGGVLTLGVERLLGDGLLLLPLVDEKSHAQLLAAEHFEVVALAGRVRRRSPCARPSRSARSPAKASACARISGTTAPSVIAVRTACSASSGRTISAGGGCRPMRCSAARISTIVPRRSSSDFWNSCSLLVERLKARLRRVDIGLDVADARGGVDELLIERAPVGAHGLDLDLELGLGFHEPRCWARVASSSWSCCLSASALFAGAVGALARGPVPPELAAGGAVGEPEA